MHHKSGEDDKRYYSISEVARMTGLEPYVLRYWEKGIPDPCIPARIAGAAGCTRRVTSR